MQEIYAFLDYELDAASHTLTRSGQSVDLRPKTLATLEHLLANRHRVVSKYDLLDAVWANADVQEQAVFQSIFELRALFSEETCIETVHGRGYRWVLPLHRDHNEEPAPAPRWIRALAATAAVLAVATTAWWYAEDDTSSLTIVIRPAEANVPALDQSTVAAGFDEMLIGQLQRFGWNAEHAADVDREPDGLTLDIKLDTADEFIQMNFVLRSGTNEEAGQMVSATPLGAVRDLAFELHESLSFRAATTADPHLLSNLFRRAKIHLDGDDYKTAEAYLTVLLTEMPTHIGAKSALAFTYRQMGRTHDALQLAFEAHDAAVDQIQRADRMMSAMLLSQLLSGFDRLTESERFAREALEIASDVNDLLIVAEAQEQLGEISVARGQLVQGKEQLNFALRYYNTFCPAGKARVAERLIDLDSRTQAAGREATRS